MLNISNNYDDIDKSWMTLTMSYHTNACVPTAAGSNYGKFSFGGSQRFTENIEYDLVNPEAQVVNAKSLDAAEFFRIFVDLRNLREI